MHRVFSSNHQHPSSPQWKRSPVACHPTRPQSRSWWPLVYRRRRPSLLQLRSRTMASQIRASALRLRCSMSPFGWDALRARICPCFDASHWSKHMPSCWPEFACHPWEGQRRHRSSHRNRPQRRWPFQIQMNHQPHSHLPLRHLRRHPHLRPPLVKGWICPRWACIVSVGGMAFGRDKQKIRCHTWIRIS